jgi:hypothetical protein
VVSYVSLSKWEWERIGATYSPAWEARPALLVEKAVSSGSS